MKLMNLCPIALLPVLMTSVSAVPSNNLSCESHEMLASPAVGLRLRREIHTRHRLVAELMKSSKNGEESISQRELDLDSNQFLTATEEVRLSDGTRPTVFQRQYESNRFETTSKRSLGRIENKDRVFKGKGSIAKKGVVFTWVPEDQNYGRYYDGLEGIEEVLPGLTADLSMASILPEGAVSPGDSWDLAPGVMVDVLACGGETDFGLAGDTGYSMMRTMRLGMGLNVEQAFGGKEEGTVKAFFLGTETVEGRDLALIQLTFDIQLEHDLAGRAQSGMSINEVASGFLVESAIVKLGLDGKGTVRWDMAGGYVYDTIKLHASQRASTRIVQIRENEEGRDEITQDLVMVGTLEHTVTCRPVE
jgi:hypothetical protein